MKEKMIYSFANTIIIPGKMAEYFEIVNKELNPIVAKVGIIPIGSFHGYTGNMNQQYTIRGFTDLAAFQKSRVAQMNDKDYPRVSAKLASLTTSTTVNFLEPNPWSPLK
jgi:hypothetical protein